MPNEIQVRRFTDRGRDNFARAVDAFLANGGTELPTGIAFDDDLTEVLEGLADSERMFSSRFELAEYLLPVVVKAGGNSAQIDAGLADWLACVYLRQLTRNGSKIKIGELARYCLSSDYTDAHRHLVAGPLETYAASGEAARLLLSNSVTTPGEIYEQVGSRRQIRTNPHVMSAAATLYLDEDGKPKRGAAGKGRSSMRRFVDLIAQLDLTYDVYAIGRDELLGLLPSEFDRWRAPAPVGA